MPDWHRDAYRAALCVLAVGGRRGSWTYAPITATIPIVPAYGHTADCPLWNRTQLSSPDLLVCRRCWPDLVPSCAQCRAPATPLEVSEDYIAYPNSKFCADCLLQVQSGGPWKERRARARETRIDALLERYPDLSTELRTWPRVVLVGVLEGRNVRITLRISAREGEYERYILKVELHEPREHIEKSALGLPEHVERNLSRAPSIVFDRFRHVRAAFGHLGKLDIVYALEAMLAAARTLDEAAIAACEASRER